MVRRSPPRRQLDDRAFPIRVLVADLARDTLALRLTEAQAWLNEHIGQGQWAMHGQSAIGLDGMGIYLRTVEAAELFLAAHPHMELADTTDRVQHLREARAHHGRKEQVHSTPSSGLGEV